MAKKLQSITWGEVIALLLGRCFAKYRLRAERAFHRHWRPGAGMDRPGDEFPKRLEMLKHCSIRVVIMCSGVVKVGCEPECVAHAGILDEREQVSDFESAPARAPGMFDARG